MSQSAKISGVFLAALFCSTPAVSEVLLIDAIAEEPSNSASGLLRPRNGQFMQAVESQFGKPEATHGPTGDPPISRWDYPAFSVYFEYNRVLTSVVRRNPAHD